MKKNQKLLDIAINDLADLILNEEEDTLDEDTIINKAYFIKDLNDLIKKEDSKCSDSATK